MNPIFQYMELQIYKLVSPRHSLINAQVELDQNTEVFGCGIRRWYCLKDRNGTKLILNEFNPNWHEL